MPQLRLGLYLLIASAIFFFATLGFVKLTWEILYAIFQLLGAFA